MINIRKLENELWEAADLLRQGSKLTSNQYCMPVLGLIFLRYAYSRYKYREDYTLENIPEWRGNDTFDFINLDEWIDASGIRTKMYNGKEYDKYDISTGEIRLWNGGQLPTNFNLYIPFPEGSNIIAGCTIVLGNEKIVLKT